MKYSIIVPFNEIDILEGEADILEEAKVLALKTANEYGTCCIVVDYNSSNENWLMECDGKDFKNIE
jgi:hypothetical protein